MTASLATQPAPAPLPDTASRGSESTLLGLLALALAVVLPPVGIVLGHVTLRHVRGLRSTGHALAVSGLVVGNLMLAFIGAVALVPLFLITV